MLFPMAIKLLPENKLVEMKHGFDKIELEKIGVGKHEQFHQMLEGFERFYLKQVDSRQYQSTKTP